MESKSSACGMVNMVEPDGRTNVRLEFPCHSWTLVCLVYLRKPIMTPQQGAITICELTYCTTFAYSHLPARGHEAPLYSLSFAYDHLSRRPRQSHPFARSSFANMDGGCADRPHPLQLVRESSLCQSSMQRTYVQCVSGKLRQFCTLDRHITYFPCTKVLILKPRVGLTVEISSSLSFLRMVVFPALSRPLSTPRQIHGRSFCRKAEQRARRGPASLSLSSCSSGLPSRGPYLTSPKRDQVKKRVSGLGVLPRSCPSSPPPTTPKLLDPSTLMNFSW